MVLLLAGTAPQDQLVGFVLLARVATMAGDAACFAFGWMASRDPGEPMKTTLEPTGERMIEGAYVSDRGSYAIYVTHTASYAFAMAMRRANACSTWAAAAATASRGSPGSRCR